MKRVKWRSDASVCPPLAWHDDRCVPVRNRSFFQPSILHCTIPYPQSVLYSLLHYFVAVLPVLSISRLFCSSSSKLRDYPIQLSPWILPIAFPFHLAPFRLYRCAFHHPISVRCCTVSFFLFISYTIPMRFYRAPPFSTLPIVPLSILDPLPSLFQSCPSSFPCSNYYLVLHSMHFSHCLPHFPFIPHALLLSSLSSLLYSIDSLLGSIVLY